MSENFIDDLIKEAEEKEELQTAAYFDLILLEIKNLNEKIAENFAEANKEMRIIEQWSIDINSKLQNKIEWLEKKLEAYIRESKEKTIDLPNGTLKFHKKQDKIEIADMELFLKKAKPELLTVVPETVKPDLNKIKAYIKSRPVPAGVAVTIGKEEFSYKLKGVEDGKEEIGIGTEQNSELRAVV